MFIKVSFPGFNPPKNFNRAELIKAFSDHIRKMNSAPEFTPYEDKENSNVVILDEDSNYKLFFYTGSNEIAFWYRYVNGLNNNLNFITKLVEPMGGYGIRVI